MRQAWFAASLLVAAALFGARPASAAAAAPRPACGDLGAALKIRGSVQAEGARSASGEAYCRVAMTLAPTPDSAIGVEVWLPDGRWNGALLGIGNHGFGGEIPTGDMAQYLARGYAVVGTDTGHRAPGAEAKWAQGHVEKLRDFGWRAVHEMTVAAKAGVVAYYGRPADHAYFLGCSTGGRQGLMEAQRFPTDYDGIVAGGAPLQWTHFVAEHLWGSRQLLGDPAKGQAPFTRAKLELVNKAVLAACDTLDGVKDGVLADPRQCRWDPRSLMCKGVPGGDCLTADEADRLRAIYAPLRDRAGKVIYPGQERSSELGWTMIVGPAGGPQPYQLILEHFRYLAFDGEERDWRSFDIGEAVRLADKLDAEGGRINAVQTDLGAFRRAGGKLIEYHGWIDQAMTPEYQPGYYDRVARATFGGRKDAQAATRSFYRLFMAPGLYHCSGGPGPNAFGGLSQPRPPSLDATHDVLEAMRGWVERGVAPARIVATKYADDQVGQVQRQVPLCPYPRQARWDGRGDPAAAASYSCRGK